MGSFAGDARKLTGESRMNRPRLGEDVEVIAGYRTVAGCSKKRAAAG